MAGCRVEVEGREHPRPWSLHRRGSRLEAKAVDPHPGLLVAPCRDHFQLQTRRLGHGEVPGLRAWGGLRPNPAPRFLLCGRGPWV